MADQVNSFFPTVAREKLVVRGADDLPAVFKCNPAELAGHRFSDPSDSTGANRSQDICARFNALYGHGSPIRIYHSPSRETFVGHIDDVVLLCSCKFT